MTQSFRLPLWAAVVAAALAAPAPAFAEGENLHIVISTPPTLGLEEVEEALTVALSKTQVKANFQGQPIVEGKLLLKRITPADYNAYQRLANPDAPLVQLPSSKTAEIEVRQLPAATPTWEFALLGMSPMELTKLEVTYEDAPTKPETLTPTTGREKGPLSFTQFNSYVLVAPALKPKEKEGVPGAEEYRRPVKYAAYVRSLGGKADRKIEGEWPKANNYYLIRLHGFKGDRKELSDIIKDPEKVPNALNSFDIKSDVTLALGVAESATDKLEDAMIEGNKLYVTVPKLKVGKAKRAYVLFPLSKEQYDERLAALRRIRAKDLPAEIGRSVVRPDKDVVLTGSTPPTWYELPYIDAKTVGLLKSDTFGRVFSLGSGDDKKVDQKEFQSLQKAYPNAYRIVVYEFDDGTNKSALRYAADPKNPNAMYTANGGEMAIWAIQLAKLAGVEPAKPKDVKKD